jgi:hypothetical protein
MTSEWDPFRQEPGPRAGRRRFVSRPLAYLLVLGVGVTVAALLAVWLLATGGSSGTAKPTSGPRLVTQTQLVRFASSLDYPVYWTGPHAGYSYELTTGRGRIWVRYLPAGVKAGDRRAGFLVVGTYREPRAYANLRRAARRSGTISKSIPGGGLVVYDQQRPTSVYFSYPGATYQVEVYAPSAHTARLLVLDGKIVPVA